MPPPQAQPGSTPPKKKGGKGKWIAGGAVVVLVLTAIGASGSSSTPTVATTTPSPKATNAAVVGASLTVASPTDGATVSTSAMTVAGTGPEGATITRDVSLGSDTHATVSNGRWSMPVELSPGDNALVFRLGEGESPTITIHVFYDASGGATEEPTASDDGTAVEPTEEITPEPTAAPTTEPTPKPTPVAYKKLTARSWKLLVKAPDKFEGKGYQFWACIWQFDAATGEDAFLGNASYKRQTYWNLYGEGSEPAIPSSGRRRLKKSGRHLPIQGEHPIQGRPGETRMCSGSSWCELGAGDQRAGSSVRRRLEPPRARRHRGHGRLA